MSRGSSTEYTIRVAGHLADHWTARLGGLRISRNDDGTSTITGPIADQAQLHGVLAALRDIGATLLELRVTAADAGPGIARASSPGRAADADSAGKPAASSMLAADHGLAHQPKPS